MNEGPLGDESTSCKSWIPIIVASCVLAVGVILSFVAYRVLTIKEEKLVQEHGVVFLNISTILTVLTHIHGRCLGSAKNQPIGMIDMAQHRIQEAMVYYGAI